MTENKRKYWLIIENYVHISIKKKNVLLYNTITGKFLIYRNQKKILELVQKIVSNLNQYVIKLDLKELDSIEINNFVNELREKFMGDIIGTHLSNKKPLAFYPILNIQQERLMIESDSLWSEGDNILNNLNEITLYVNNYNKNEISNYADAYKQFSYPYFNNKIENLNYKSINVFLKKLNMNSIYNLNLLGGNILEYKHLNALIEFLSKQSYKKTIIMRLFDLIINNTNKLHQNIEILLKHNNLFSINCIIDTYKNQMENIKFIGISQEIFKKIEYVFIACNESQLNNIENITTKSQIKTYRIIPYFNGNNMDFFEKYVYMEENDILDIKPNLNMIFSNQVINRNHFGKVTILNNGDIFTNVNFPKVGNIENDSLKRIIYEEMRTGNVWKKTRTKVTPCKNCIYELLCPSISNYEYFLNKMNLCKLAD